MHKEKSKTGVNLMMQPQWLPVIMQGSSDEIYVMDSSSLQLIYVNESACKNNRYRNDELRGLTLHDITDGLAGGELEQWLGSIRESNDTPYLLNTVLVRKDGSRYPIALRFFYCDMKPSSVLIAVGRSAISPGKDDAQEESFFNAIVSNTPGLVYQFIRMSDGSVSFPYLSDGCQALLGLTTEQLHADPSLFMTIIIPQDRHSYAESMASSAASLVSWNWEGRIWVDAWKDTKWINLRATPRAMSNGGVRWDGIMTNITQSKLAEMEIKHSRTSLAELSAHIEHVKEEERARMAREIHDDLGGNLTAIKMAMALLAKRLPQDNTELAEKAAYVDLLVDRTIEAAHRIASDLRPSILDIGIVAALEWQAREFGTQLGIPCRFTSNPSEIELHSDQATAIFRISQEALTNIAKHAEATRVRMELLCTKSSLRLKITDNGKGMNPKDRFKPQSFGIRGMTERAHSLGGNLTIEPAPRGGNRVAVILPLSSRQQGGRNRNGSSPSKSNTGSIQHTA